MNATSVPSSAPLLSPFLAEQLRRFGPLIAIIALHVAVFYVLQSGLMHRVAQALPKEMFVSLIAEEPAAHPKAQPAEPKTVPVVKKSIARPTPRPVVTRTPSPQAITESATPPQESKEAPATAAPAAAAPAASASPATPKTISGVSYINAPRPVYPPLDARMGNEGTVTLRVLINETGHAEKIDIQKSSGSLRMDDAARDAVMCALFKPYLEDGKPTPAFAIVPINFTLNR